MRILEWLSYLFGWIFGTAKRYYMTPGFTDLVICLTFIIVMAWIILGTATG